MKKLLLILLLCGFVYSQQIDTTIVGEELIITETPSEVQPRVSRYNILWLKNKWHDLKIRRDEIQDEMNNLKWIMKYSPEVVAPDSSMVLESLDEILEHQNKFYTANREETVAYLESIKIELSGQFENIAPEVFDILGLLIDEAESRFYVSARERIVEELELVVGLLNEF